MVIGLTGGIGSGKSFVAQLLSKKGASIIDADEIYATLIEPGSFLQGEIIHLWGEDMLQADGELDRKKLGAIIFSSQSERKRLNSLTHPHIIKKIKEEIAQSKDTVFLVAPLLIETGLQNIVDEIWLITINRDIQLARLMQRDKLSKEEAEIRMGSQAPQDEKKKYADYIIDNNGSRKKTEEQVEKLWKSLKTRTK